ncbi:maleylpyruvate isomerase family mycothiol-dependent enzyme [Streptomyces fulvoviolaceus]|uniref:maleylpyruvate isomerase family mycothiol-dependent enzyme n=1 Tax=Streptomyces fulvoviolaceus TaxID=285535 RepID=UPI0021BF473C|nr:maleylpyruvate isomerase family mycothiol-dependent enzyme [Streptomyces fulvoviolaceus]MCT9084347.1 maleylpyruvate isomerase family mycothiol-dependent enzyme [Streptomyces fulvoviolaceus]
MTTDHDGVRDLLAAWAFGALEPADEKTVPLHLAECESCAAEAEQLRETVRLLDGPPLNGLLPDEPLGLRNGTPGVLSGALRTRPAAAPHVAGHAAPYAAAVAGLKALLPEIEGRWTTPVVHDWDVHATVAHLLAADEHLARLLGMGPRVPPSRIAEDTRWADAWDQRTADVITHEHGRTPEETVADWSAQADGLLAAPEARDHELAARAVMLMGVRLPVADHFVVRAFEAWIHTDDIGRALGLAVPPPPEGHLWQLVRLAVRILGLSLGPTAPPVLFSVTGGEEWVLGSEDEPVQAELTLDPVDFCLLVGGRYAPDEVPRGTAGDEAAVRNVLERASQLAWL